jgi:hypothetical protein
MMNEETLVFNVQTPLGFSVHVTRSYWERIVQLKHPSMRGREADVADTLRDPVEVRRSRKDPDVYLFYKLESPGKWICAVVKRTGYDGFLVTTYVTRSIKEGAQLWSK